MKGIVTHTNVDLDAIASVIAVAGRDPHATFHFWPSNVSPQPGDPCPCCKGIVEPDWTVVDHPAGDKGRLDANGTRHAALLSLEEAKSWDPALVAEVDEQDSTGRVLQPRFSLATLVAAARRAGLNDEAMIETFQPILHGLNLLYQDRKEAERVADSVAAVCLGTGERLAILPEGSTTPLLGIVLNERGYSGAIYQDGLNLGVTRYPGRETPDLRKLEPYLPGWFVHTSGFLAAWGSRKAPATSPPPEGTPKNQVELAHLLLKVFQ